MFQLLNNTKIYSQEMNSQEIPCQEMQSQEIPCQEMQNQAVNNMGKNLNDFIEPKEKYIILPSDWCLVNTSKIPNN